MQALFFPTICPFCFGTHTSHHIFCDTCASLLHFLTYPGRCRRCFTPLKKRRLCLRCQKNPLCYRKRAALFSPIGPALLLARRIEQDPKTLAALFVLQLLYLEWRIPDYIIAHKKERAIGKYIGHFLGIPLYPRWSRPIGYNLLYIECQHIATLDPFF